MSQSNPASDRPILPTYENALPARRQFEPQAPERSDETETGPAGALDAPGGLRPADDSDREALEEFLEYRRLFDSDGFQEASLFDEFSGLEACGAKGFRRPCRSEALRGYAAAGLQTHVELPARKARGKTKSGDSSQVPRRRYTKEVKLKAIELFNKGYGYKRTSLLLDIPAYTVRDWNRLYKLNRPF